MKRVTKTILLLVAVAAVLTACSSGGGVDALPLAGTWQGTWNSNTGPGGSVSVEFEQEGNSLTGTVQITGSPCLTNGTVTGNVSSSGATFGAVQGPHQITFTGSRNGSNQLSGTYAVGSGPCEGDAGVFTVTRVSD